jgi:hypothetical protein
LGPGFVDGTNITSHNKLFQKMVIRRPDIQQNGTQQKNFISNANNVILSLRIAHNGDLPSVIMLRVDLLSCKSYLKLSFYIVCNSFKYIISSQLRPVTCTIKVVQL